MKKVLALILSLAMVCTSFSIPVSAQNSDSSPITLIVELEENAVLDSAGARELGSIAYNKTAAAQETESRLLTSQAKVQKTITSSINSNAEVGYTYTSLLNGFSIEADVSDIDSIKAIPGVKAVYVSGISKIPTPIKESEQSAAVSTGSGVGLCCDDISVSYMHNLGYNGQGQVVCVIDTELDVNHEMFADEVENPRYTKEDIAEIIASKPFNVSNVTADRVYHSSKLPFVYNYYKATTDTYNNDEDITHGSHVSGIAAGKNGTNPDGSKFSGVAPEAQLVFMATANENGGIPNATAIAALDDAAKLDVCAVNMSFGIANVETNSAYEKAVKTATDAGIYISVAAGNDGRGINFTAYADEPCYNTSGMPDSATQASSVASSNAANKWQIRYLINTVSNSITIINSNCTDFISLFDNNSYEFVDCGSATAQELAELDLTGKIAIADRSINPYYKNETMVNAIASKGAVGVIVVNIDDSIPEGSRINMGSVTIPFAVLNKSDGTVIRNEEDKTILSATKTGVRLTTSGGISSFSSWSTNPSLELKPEITAPGGMIYSAIPDNKYAVWGGTSMAAPHIAGAATLMSSYINDNYTAEEIGNKSFFIQNLLMTSAQVMYQNNSLPYSPRNQGAGLVDLEAATKTPVILTGTENKTKISLKELDSENYTLNFTAHNYSDRDVTYDATLFAFTDDAAEANGRYIVNNSKSLTFTSDLPDTITVPANDTLTVTVNVTLDKTELESNKEIFTNGFYVDGYVILTPQDSANSEISIPYTGFYGDIDSVSAFGKRAFDSPDGYDRLGSYDNKCICTSDNTVSCQALGFNSVREKLVKYNYAEDYDESEYDKEIFAGYSPNNDGVSDGLCFMHQLLRGLYDVTFTITDADNNTVYSTAYSVIDKYYKNCVDISKSFSEGDYVFKIKGRPYGDDADYQSQTFSFYVDNTKPQINKITTRTDGDRKYLDVELSDNKYLMGAVLEESTKTTSNTTSIPSKEDALNLIKPLNSSEASISFDITDLNLSACSLSVSDYAGNVTTATINGLEASYVGSLAGSSSLTVSFEVSNRTGESMDAAVVMTLYDKNYKPLDIQYIEKQTFIAGNTPLIFSIADSSDVMYAELDIWDSLADMHPMTDSVLQKVKE